MLIKKHQGEIGIKDWIFCNRSLNMKNIQFVGFDMDYTLALYKPKTFEALAYKQTQLKLVKMGYPKEILKFKFDWEHMIRGLVIDKARGNVFKMDRHRYVKMAFHGFKEISREERKRLYDSNIVHNYEEPNFAMIDTLFTLVDAYLFCQLVEYKDANAGSLDKSYAQIFADVRSAIDECHRDGSIKEVVKENLGLYIERDEYIIETLDRIRKSGRKVFLLTNSLWSYTDPVMTYLFSDKRGKLIADWKKYFDVIITGASKPRFFMANNPLYEVNPRTGALKNIEGGTLEARKIYQGGSVKDLYELLGVQIGSQILYVGDHIYGDILRSKKELGWRTMLVVTELEHELQTLMDTKSERLSVEDSILSIDEIEDELEHLGFAIESGRGKISSAKLKEMQTRSEELIKEGQRIREKMRANLKSYHEKFHPVWGELMKCGYQNSRFAAQVTNYACLYTSRFTNLRFCSPSKTFRSYRDFMPHDLI